MARYLLTQGPTFSQVKSVESFLYFWDKQYTLYIKEHQKHECLTLVSSLFSGFCVGYSLPCHDLQGCATNLSSEADGQKYLKGMARGSKYAKPHGAASWWCQASSEVTRGSFCYQSQEQLDSSSYPTSSLLIVAPHHRSPITTTLARKHLHLPQRYVVHSTSSATLALIHPRARVILQSNQTMSRRHPASI